MSQLFILIIQIIIVITGYINQQIMNFMILGFLFILIKNISKKIKQQY